MLVYVNQKVNKEHKIEITISGWVKEYLEDNKHKYNINLVSEGKVKFQVICKPEEVETTITNIVKDIHDYYEELNKLENKYNRYRIFNIDTQKEEKKKDETYGGLSKEVTK